MAIGNERVRKVIFMKKIDIVSIIIPCRNEERYIAKCLDSVIANDYPKDRLEVLVVDGMSEDGTRGVIQRYTRQYSFIRLLDNPKKVTPAALNTGIKESKGEIILRMDAHASYGNRYISKCVEYLNKYNVDNVGGTVVTVSKYDTFVGKSIVCALTNRFGVGNSDFRIGTNKPKFTDTVFGGCYRRETFKKIGYFNEYLRSAQDIEFNLRLRQQGGKIMLFPDIVSQYYSRSDIRSFLKNALRIGTWVILPFKYTDVFPVALRHLVPLAFVSSLLIFGILSFFSTFFLLCLLFAAFSYILCNFFFSVRIAIAKKDLRLLFSMPVIFTILHISYGLAGIWGLSKCLISERFWKNLGKMRRENLKTHHTTMSYNKAKRLFDIVTSILLSVLLFSPFAIIALVIKLTSKGPVLYVTDRVGIYNRIFKMYKFRTMKVDTPRVATHLLENPGRYLTPFGVFLRKTSLDELPQLFNILKGDMSFVGPRPALFNQDDLVALRTQKDIHTLIPGVSGWAQINGRDELLIPVKVEYDEYCLKHRSFVFDIDIICKTIFKVAKGAGIKEGNIVQEHCNHECKVK